MVHCQLPKQRQRRMIWRYLVYLRFLFKDNASSEVDSTSIIKPKREIYYPIMKINWIKIIKWNLARDCCNREFYYMFLIIWRSDSNMVPPFSASSFEDIFFAYFQTFLIFLILIFFDNQYISGKIRVNSIQWYLWNNLITNIYSITIFWV